MLGVSGDCGEPERLGAVCAVGGGGVAILFAARAGDYATGDPVPLLVERIESLATSETTSWAKSSQSTETGSTGPAHSA